MTHAAYGAGNRRRHKKILKLAKGYRNRNKNCYRVAKQKVEKALQYAYRDRRNKKRDFRGLWIARINAAARQHGMSYSKLMHGLKLAEVDMDRKVLAWLAINDEKAFGELAAKARQSIQ